MLNKNHLKQTLPEPKRPESLASSAQWLAGEGAGSWFCIEITLAENNFLIKRFSPAGKLECEGLFKLENKKLNLDLNKHFKFVHLSHCAFVHIEQYGKVLKLNRY